MNDSSTPEQIAAERRVRRLLSAELAVQPRQVEAAVDLLDGGATVPFIARYRKEATDGLDDTQLRTLEERLIYLRDLESRRLAILASINEQGQMTDPLRLAIDAAVTKQALEDLYLPFKPRRRSRAQAAREAGLEPLAEALLADPEGVPQQVALPFVNPELGVADTKAALDGARDILTERFAERPEVLTAFRAFLWDEGVIGAKLVEGKSADAEKFRDYFDHAESIASTPSHRALALFRGRQLGVLSLSLGLSPEREALLNQIQVKSPQDWQRYGGKLMENLQQYPRDGCCVSVGEVYADVQAVAVPLGRIDRGELAAINCSFQGRELDETWLRQRIAPQLQAVVRQLT
jgi:transcriptional accessory protein Tex/SPT6